VRESVVNLAGDEKVCSCELYSVPEGPCECTVCRKKERVFSFRRVHFCNFPPACLLACLHMKCSIAGGTRAADKSRETGFKLE
jgi:hypothetical protein